MKKYRIKVETPGKLIFYKNRKIRTPFILEIDDSELELFKSTMISSAIESYKLEEIKKDGEVNEWEKVIIPEDKNVVIEDLYEQDDEEEEPSTLLKKLLRDEKRMENKHEKADHDISRK